MVNINGRETDAAGKTVAAYLTESGYDVLRVAVERNGAIVPKGDFSALCLAEEDVLEVVSFVGGG